MNEILSVVDQNDVEDNLECQVNESGYDEQTVEVTVSEYNSFLRDLAALSIKLFFKDKSMFCGGPIPLHLMISDFYIKQVLYTDIEQATKAVYSAWCIDNSTAEEMREFQSNGGIPEDVEMVITVLSECARLKMPQDLSPGIMMMYFEFCEGFNFNPVVGTIGTSYCQAV